MFALILGTAVSLIPIHGAVIQPLGSSAVILRTDPVPAMLPATIGRYRIEPPQGTVAGTTMDGLLDRSTQPPTLRDAHPAGAFAPGLPEPGRVIALELGDRVPATHLVDQRGRPVDLARDFSGKTTLLSFAFTRCPDRTLCPAISGKFAYLQTRLDPRRFALIEITLDPQYDSPAVLRAYGARFGADPAIWSLLTGTGSEIKHVLDRFRISSLRVSSENFVHDDKLFIVTPQGRIGYIAATGGWDPDAALAQARDIAGLSSNPFERFKLSLIAGVVALCGGSQFAGIVLLELALFVLVLAAVAAGLWWVSRALWARP